MKSVNIPAAKSVVGTSISFDDAGDTIYHDITILVVKNNTETTLKKLTVK